MRRKIIPRHTPGVKSANGWRISAGTFTHKNTRWPLGVEYDISLARYDVSSPEM